MKFSVKRSLSNSFGSTESRPTKQSSLLLQTRGPQCLVESLDGRKHHHGDHNGAERKREPGTVVCPWHGRSLVSRVEYIERKGCCCCCFFSWSLGRNINPLGRLAADWFGNGRYASSRRLHRPYTERPSRSFSFPPYGNYYIHGVCVVTPPTLISKPNKFPSAKRWSASRLAHFKSSQQTQKGQI